MTDEDPDAGKKVEQGLDNTVPEDANEDRYCEDDESSDAD